MESRSTRPAASKAAASPAPQRRDSYRVQRGDTLYTIAWQRGIDYRQLAAWNGIRPPYHIYPGQTLSLVPRAAGRVPPATAPQVAKVPPAATRPPQREQAVRQPSTGAASAQHAPAKPTPPPQRPAPPTQAAKDLVWRWPAQGKILSTFKAGEPLRNGIRIGGRAGDPIRAAEAGRVVYSGSGLIGYGQLIIIKHNDNYLSAYGLNREILVAEGDQVTKGQGIATMGVASDGSPQLHFEIRRDGKPVDPQRVLPRR